MSIRFDGRVAIVTGAGAGLGRSHALGLAARGAKVVVNDLGAATDGSGASSEAARSVVEEIRAKGGHAIANGANVTNEAQVQTMIDEAIAEFGHVDILVNNAGVGTAVPATHETPEQFRSVLDVNLFGAYWMAQAFAKANKNGGAIVNISSILGIKPQGLPQAAYASSKAGLIGLTRDLAAQWTGRKNIRVNALAPGFFPSEMSDELPKDMVNMIKMFAPAGRLGDPEELAATLIWLVSDASSYVTGITVPVDGGLVMP